MIINLTDRIEVNNEYKRLGLNDTPIKTEAKVTLSQNIKKPITASYVSISSDGDLHESRNKYYSYNQDKKGDFYINLNVGNGYKKVKVIVNELIKEDSK